MLNRDLRIGSSSNVRSMGKPHGLTKTRSAAGGRSVGLLVRVAGRLGARRSLRLPPLPAHDASRAGEAEEAEAEQRGGIGLGDEVPASGDLREADRSRDRKAPEPNTHNVIIISRVNPRVISRAIAIFFFASSKDYRNC